MGIEHEADDVRPPGPEPLRRPVRQVTDLGGDPLHAPRVATAISGALASARDTVATASPVSVAIVCKVGLSRSGCGAIPSPTARRLSPRHQRLPGICRILPAMKI